MGEGSSGWRGIHVLARGRGQLLAVQDRGEG